MFSCWRYSWISRSFTGYATQTHLRWAVVLCKGWVEYFRYELVRDLYADSQTLDGIQNFITDWLVFLEFVLVPVHSKSWNVSVTYWNVSVTYCGWFDCTHLRYSYNVYICLRSHTLGVNHRSVCNSEYHSVARIEQSHSYFYIRQTCAPTTDYPYIVVGVTRNANFFERVKVVVRNFRWSMKNCAYLRKVSLSVSQTSH